MRSGGHARLLVNHILEPASGSRCAGAARGIAGSGAGLALLTGLVGNDAATLPTGVIPFCCGVCTMLLAFDMHPGGVGCNDA